LKLTAAANIEILFRTGIVIWDGRSGASGESHGGVHGPGLQYETATIGADNTTTIYNMRNQTLRGAHYLINNVHGWMETAVNHGPTGRDIGLVWTPGHIGVEGKKRADEHAKMAAKGNSSIASTLPKLLHKSLPISRSATRKTYKEATKKVLKERLTNSKQIRKIQHFDSIFKPLQFEMLASTLPRRYLLILIQL
jgi:hypothetical protein